MSATARSDPRDPRSGGRSWSFLLRERAALALLPRQRMRRRGWGSNIFTHPHTGGGGAQLPMPCHPGWFSIHVGTGRDRGPGLGKARAQSLFELGQKKDGGCNLTSGRVWQVSSADKKKTASSGGQANPGTGSALASLIISPAQAVEDKTRLREMEGYLAELCELVQPQKTGAVKSETGMIRLSPEPWRKLDCANCGMGAACIAA
ncbi:hypothetical protein B0T24DRAFT_140740 [Lasiosphaeria ovina]|uniref:Uncharacterized protein n=1 Tax=Lasiosphaeria ovina TaxID=92902 RepID=A0AAE0KLH2_9PEZI|nr:hypothetical protein B0T24DRAFT_140740 [Lasiosphaeria ovina]